MFNHHRWAAPWRQRVLAQRQDQEKRQNAILTALGSAARSSLLGIGIMAFSITAFADTLSLTELPPQSATMGGVYTSPYTINVSPNTTIAGAVPQLLICDDFTTDIYLGLQWTANATTLSSVSTGSVTGLKFAANPGSVLDSDSLFGLTSGKVVDDYAMAAVLSAELLTMPGIATPSEDPEKAGELSYAIWSLFDDQLYGTLPSTGYGNLDSTEVAAVNMDLAWAAAKVAAATDINHVVNLNQITINGNAIENLTVYTPQPMGIAQEFLQVTIPEPSSLPILFIGLLGLLGMARYRKSAKTKA